MLKKLQWIAHRIHLLKRGSGENPVENQLTAAGEAVADHAFLKGIFNKILLLGMPFNAEGNCVEKD